MTPGGKPGLGQHSPWPMSPQYAGFVEPYVHVQGHERVAVPALPGGVGVRAGGRAADSVPQAPSPETSARA
jgi:hypothetical protein